LLFRQAAVSLGDGAGEVKEVKSEGGFGLARTSKKRTKVSVKDLKYKHDPMIRLYDRTQEWLQERARPFVIAIGIVVGAVVLYLAGSYFLDYRRSKAEAAYADAAEKFNAQVQESSVTTTTPTTGKFYSDEATKWKESAEAFDKLAADYPGYYGTIGRYYAGVSYLHIDRDKGLSMLEQVAAKNDKPTSNLARLALAENCLANGDSAKAIANYEQVLSSADNMKPAIQLGLARAYERNGDTEKAVENYFEAAKPDRLSPVGAEAEKQLKRLAPDKIKDLPVSGNPVIQP
jgi:tetratricopeptide (TPR) repeat protein